MTFKPIAVSLLGLAGLVACSKPSAETQPTASANAPLTDEALDKARIPVKEDFEEQAHTTITDDNLDDQVAQLATEIENDR